MSKLQRAYSCFFSLCLAGMLLFLPGQFFFFPGMPKSSFFESAVFSGNVYRLLPLYSYLENQITQASLEDDKETSGRIIEANIITEKTEKEKYKSNQNIESVENKDFFQEKEEQNTGENRKPEETQTIQEHPGKAEIQTTGHQEQEATKMELSAIPKTEISINQLMDYDYLMNHFYIVDENTATTEEQIDAIRFLNEDLSVVKDPSKPQILIYHSHSQETFADSREGEPEDTVVGIGDYLARLLTEQYGYHVLHIKETFDLFDGELDRSRAYDAARDYVEQVLQENPSLEVVIDLHRDGVPEDRHLVTTINGKETAQILFYNGLSYTRSQGPVSYLPNPYIQQNLAFSFRLNYLAEQYFPGFSRGIYLAGLRYNLHLCPRALLLEAGAQTNTIQEVKNAMEPFAAILDCVLQK